jgi:fucose permease
MLLNFTIFGATLTLIGAALPQILGELGWNYTQAGAVISAGAIGYFISTFLCGILTDRIGPRLVIASGLLLQAVGLSLFAITPVFLINMPLQFLIGFGQGGTEVVVNFSVVRIEKGGQSRLMNLMHASFSFGAIISSFIIGRLTTIESGWHLTYRGLAILSFMMAVSMFFIPFELLEKKEIPVNKNRGNLHLLKKPLLIFSFLILLLYVGSEMGVSSWVAEYYVKVLHTTSSVGAYMVSLLWAGILIGRLGISAGYRGSKQPELLFTMSVMCLLSLIFATMMKKPVSAGAGFFISGLGYSAIYPVVIALVGRGFPESQSTAIGFTSTGGGVGAFIFPFVMAAISERFGLKNGFFFYIILNAAMVTLSWAVLRHVRTPIVSE